MSKFKEIFICDKCLKEVTTLVPFYDESHPEAPPIMVCADCITKPSIQEIYLKDDNF